MFSPKTKKAINFALSIIKILDIENHDRLKLLFENSSEEDVKRMLCNPLELYFTPKKEPSKQLMMSIIKKYKIILSEKFIMPSMQKNKNNKNIPISNKTILCLPTYIRRNQQTHLDSKSADNSNVRNMLGNVAGDSRKGSLNDTQIITLVTQGGYDITKELMSVGSNDLEAKREFKKKLQEEGHASLDGITNKSSNKRGLIYMDRSLKVMGFDTDLISPPLK